MSLLEHLAITTKSVTHEQVILTMPVTKQHQQPFGVLHGGLNAVLIETACSLGANQQLTEPNTHAAGVDLQVNHLKAVTSGIVTCIAKPNHIGRTLQVWEASIYNDRHELTSIGRCTLTRISTKK